MKCISCDKPATNYVIVKKADIIDKKESTRKVYDKEDTSGPVNRISTEFIFNKEAEDFTFHICNSCKRKRMIEVKRKSKIIMTVSTVIFLISLVLMLLSSIANISIINTTLLKILFNGSVLVFLYGGFKYIVADETEEEFAHSILYLALEKNILKLPSDIEFIEDASLIPYDDLFLKRKEGDIIYMTTYEWDILEKAQYKLKIIYDDGEIHRIIPEALGI